MNMTLWYLIPGPSKKNYLLHTCTILVQRYSLSGDVSMQFLHAPCCLHFVHQTSLIPWFITRKDGMYCTGHLPFIWRASYNLPLFCFLASLVISCYRLKSAMPLYFSDVLLYIYLFDILTFFLKEIF
jgi:hypothetical protein